MANRDLGEILKRLPLFQAHFGWGPLNSVLLLAGMGVTIGLEGTRGRLSDDALLATGLAAIFLLVVAQLQPRWDAMLGSLLAVGIGLGVYAGTGAVLVGGIALSAVLACCVQVASHWDKAILLRVGHFKGLRGPGLFFIVPFIDRLESFVDQRLRATDFRAERILTLDTVPVYVDAICFWLVWNAEKAVLEVADYGQAVILSAQTALKDAVGRHELSSLLSDRHKLGTEIQQVLEEKTSAWGITIQSIEITDIMIPEGLEEAMSKRAQAEREGQARIILSTTEAEIAKNFTSAADEYRDDPVALHLRAMNMVYEGIRQQGSMILVPSSAVETMGMGVPGYAALAKIQEAASGGVESPAEPASDQQERVAGAAGDAASGTLRSKRPG